MDPDEQDNYEEKDIELNQAGRPKQVVILYKLT